MSKQAKEGQIDGSRTRFSLLEWSQIISSAGACVAAFCSFYAANKANSISERVEAASERNGCITDLVKSTDSLKEGMSRLIKTLARDSVEGPGWNPQATLDNLSETEVLLDQFDADLRKHGCNQEIGLSEGISVEVQNLKHTLTQSPVGGLKLEPIFLSSSMVLAADSVPKGLRVLSEVKGLAFTLLRDLPKPPEGEESSEEKGMNKICIDRNAIRPNSPAGKKVAARGWAVLSEVKVGKYQAVSFAGAFDPVMGSICNVDDGSVAFFDGTQQVALISSEKSDTPKDIGKVEPHDGGGARLWDGGAVSAPLGDIQLMQDGSLHLSALPKEDLLCHGKAIVPNIYTLPINEARKILMSKGWNPVKRKAKDLFGVRTLVKHGIVEVEECSGMGFNFCNFIYQGSGGKLTVETSGEDDFPSVIGYDVKCK